MGSRVYETVGRPSVCPSVCPIDRQQRRRAAGLLWGDNLLLLTYYPSVEVSGPDALGNPAGVDQRTEHVGGTKQSQVEERVLSTNQRPQVGGGDCTAQPESQKHT